VGSGRVNPLAPPINTEPAPEREAQRRRCRSKPDPSERPGLLDRFEPRWQLGSRAGNVSRLSALTITKLYYVEQYSPHRQVTRRNALRSAWLWRHHLEALMADTLDPALQDDAPVTASKRSDTIDRATDELIEPKGDTLAGRG
jgi:hypothetical protein